MVFGLMCSPQRSSLRQPLALVWRTLRSMRTALILLLLIGLASVVGSLVPQRPNTPQSVLQYRLDHRFWGTFFERAGLFDVFGSWWFVLLVVLLFTSLVACLVPRTRALWRALRSKPVQARELSALPHHAEVEVPTPPDQALEISRRVLRRRWYRVARDPDHPALAAERGLAREVGSLAFHWAFIFLLAGVMYGKGTGFSGFAVVVEGQTWVDAQANYDGTLKPGRFFDGDFTGVGLRLNEFRNPIRRTGMPKDFVSDVDLLAADGSLIQKDEIRVNQPGQVAGISIFQVNYGWAPMFEIRQAGTVRWSGPVLMDQLPAPDGVPAAAMPWRGFIKLPGAGKAGTDRAVELELWSDGRALAAALLGGSPPQPMLIEFDPVVRFSLWEGRLSDLATNRLDTSTMEVIGSGIVRAEGRADLVEGTSLQTGERGSGTTIAFPKLRQYSVFQVSRDDGVPWVLAAAILILVALLPALYGSRRKIWVHVRHSADGAVVQVGGLAMQRKPQFADEFARLTMAIASGARLGSPGPLKPEPDQREKVRTP